MDCRMTSASLVSPAVLRHVSQCSMSWPATSAPWQPMAVLAAAMRAASTSGLGSDRAPEIRGVESTVTNFRQCYYFG